MPISTETCNMALAHLGVGKQISNIDTEHSTEALFCKTFYDLSLKTTLAAFEWTFASRILTLGLVAEQPNNEWAYAYRYPQDSVEFRRILGGNRNPTKSGRVKFRIIGDDAGRLILTDQALAQGEYTKLVTDTSLYPPVFSMAHSYQLAALLASPLTKGDPYRLIDRMEKLFMAKLSEAGAHDANEEEADESPESEFILGRN